VFERIWPEDFLQLMIGLSGALHESFDGKIISIDGKSLRGSFCVGSAGIAHSTLSKLGERDL